MLKILTGLLGRKRRASTDRAALPLDEPPVLLGGTGGTSAADDQLDSAVRQLERFVEDQPGNAEAHLALGDLLYRRKRLDEARDSCLVAFGLRPDWWLPHYRLGLIALAEERWTEAIAALRQALHLGACEAHVHNALGAAYVHSGNHAEGLEHFQQALVFDPDLVDAHSNLGYTLFHDLERYEEGERHIERALELAPDNAGALCNRMMVLSHQGHDEKVLELADVLLQREPDSTAVRLNRGLVLLKKGEFAKGWADYEARKLMPPYQRTAALPWPEWDGSSLAGRRVYVYPEQGLGDEIMFASCLPDLIAHAGHCVLECDPKLTAIFRRSFPEAVVLTRDEWRNDAGIATQPPDCKVAIGSLPRFFRPDRASFPAREGYLQADADKVAGWKSQLAETPGRIKVGISWRGGLASTRRNLRSIPLDEWLPILSIPDITFVSLQYSAEAEAELEAFRKQHGTVVVHWPEAIADYDETAALVCALDLVISVQTALVHLAGAVGQRTWALLSALPEWRYGVTGSSMPWYPHVELIRQERPYAWGGVFDHARRSLQARLAPQ